MPLEVKDTVSPQSHKHEGRPRIKQFLGTIFSLAVKADGYKMVRKKEDYSPMIVIPDLPGIC